MKKKKVVTIVISSILAVSIAGVGFFYATGKLGTKNAASTTNYEVAKLTTGDLQKSIKGSGTLSTKGSASETASMDMTVDTVAVKAGQRVKKGDTVATIDTSALDETIIALQNDISTIDSTLAQAAAKQDSTITVKSQVAGRIKQVFAVKGDDAKNISTTSGGLLVLSTDGFMKLETKLDSSSLVKSGDEVIVKSGGHNYDGLVGSVSADGTSCTITLTDNGPKLDAEAIVFNDDNERVGQGTLAINQPFYVTTNSGIVNKVYKKENQKITTSSSLFYLESVPVTEDYANQMQTRAEKVDLLNQAMALKSSGNLLATQDGIIETVSFKDGQVLKADDVLFTLLTGGTATLEVEIDELDIANVKVGQIATVAIDAIVGKTFDAAVKDISQVGTASNGVTTYTVTLDLSGEEVLRVGMNATATIVIEQKNGVLLLPLEALQTVRGEQFVWLYNGELPTDGTVPGTRTVVTTGLSDDNNVEVLTGLTQQDQVVIVRAKTSSTSTKQSGMNFAGMGGQMGTRPSGAGGTRPQGE